MSRRQATFTRHRRFKDGYDNNNLTIYSKEEISGVITYDELNRKRTETVNYGPFSKSYSYEYEGFTKKSYTSPEGTTYSYGYDQSDRIKAITFGDKTIGFSYDKTRLQAVALPNGVTTGYGYKGVVVLIFAACIGYFGYSFVSGITITSETTKTSV